MEPLRFKQVSNTIEEQSLPGGIALSDTLLSAHHFLLSQFNGVTEGTGLLNGEAPSNL